MPLRIYNMRPLGRRYVQPRVVRPAGGGGGGDIGGTLGRLVAGLMQQRQAAQQQAKINAVANQLMNTANPPRAGLVAPGVNPATGRPNVIPAGVPTTGTAPSTGGLAEMRVRQEFEKNQLADAYQKARIANLLNPPGRGGRGAGGGGVGGTGTGNAQRWTQYLGGQGSQGGGGKPGKPAPYVPNSIDANTDPRADDFSKIQADFDAKYGKGAYGKVAPNLGTAQPSSDGKSVIIGSNPDKPVMTMSPQEAQYWKNRYNAANVAAGHPTIGGLGPGTNPNSGQAAGTEVNPAQVKNNLDLRALPMGTWFTGPDGQTHQKIPQAAPQGQGQQGGGQQGGGTAGTTSDQGAADEQAAEEQATQEEAQDQAAQDQQGQPQGQVAQGGQPVGQVVGGDQGDQGQEQPQNAGLVGANEDEAANPDEDTLNRPEDLWT
jgi:hypothetical protein